jgi:lyso-ornithine lipid O-acyltransferase
LSAVSRLAPAPAPTPATSPNARPNLRGALKIALLLAVAGSAALVQTLVLRLKPSWGGFLPRQFHRAVCAILGVRLTVLGDAPAAGVSSLIVANHVSWLDIPVIGTQRPMAFVAKSEIAGWPGVGFLARLQRTIFLDRSRKTATAAIASVMGERLSGGESVVLFAEGTTGDGSRIMPFRSSLLGAVKEALGPEGQTDSGDTATGEIRVQPLALLYLGRNGIPGGRHGRAELAWYGDTELAPHLFAVLNGGPIDVTLVWGEPLMMGREHSRKEAARMAEAAVRAAAVAHFTGRSRGVVGTAEFR